MPLQEPLAPARAWLAGTAAAPADAAGCVALAWALKSLCDQAWNTDPPATRAIAAAAARLADLAPPGAAATVAAVARWLQGVAALTRGAVNDAALAFDEAHAVLQRAGCAAEAAQVLVPRIVALSVLGRHAEALACGRTALRSLQAFGDRRTAAKVRLNLGNLEVRVGAYADALDDYRRAAVEFARLGDREHSVMADIGTADALAALGQLDDALRTAHRAGQRAVLHDLPVLGALARETAALVYLARGDFRDALAGLEAARRAYASIGMPQHEATVEKQLADAYLELRLLPEAEALLRCALPRLAALELHVETAWAHLQLARVLLQRARPAAEVAAELARAAALFAQQEVPVGRSTVDWVDAESLLAGGDADAALVRARRAAEGLSRDGAADLQLRARATIARALLARGELASAQAEAAHTAAEAAALGLQALRADALALHGRAAWALGRTDTAAADYAEAVRLLELQRTVLPDDTLRRAFLAQRLDAYEGALRAALQRDAPPAQVLWALEAFRARGLDDRLHGGHASTSAEAGDPQAETLRARLDWWYRRALRQRENGDSPSESWRHAATLEAELREHLRRSGFDRPGGEGGSLDAAADDAAALCERLARGEAVIAYGALDDEVLAVSLTRDGPRIHRRLAAWPAVVAALAGLRFQIDSLRVGPAAVKRHMPQLVERTRGRLQALQRLLWAPLREALGRPQRLLFVPQRELIGVPFAALHDGQDWLLRESSIAQAHSVRAVLHGMARSPATPRTARAWGEDSRLPHAGEEALGAVAAYGDGQAFTGAAADVASFVAHAPAADVLHLACHGEFRADNPTFSALHLADGTLTADVVAQLRLRPCTVVLGACDSARAAGGRGDEVAGFTRAFIEAGAARVVASLWPVADARSVAPMLALHAALATGRPVAEALREVQLESLRAHPHPLHWAGLAAYGGW
ncbi:MAG: CHAT domain-containing protein [Burkholderiaceae bacterium]|nr:CHAT domain-containing protein [Burkholderiaceae bacterium]